MYGIVLPVLVVIEIEFEPARRRRFVPVESGGAGVEQ